MIWSQQELARLAVCKEDVIVDRVMKHLDEAANDEIWQPENFSFVWGLLGVVGTAGLSSYAAEKIWKSLNDNQVLDAFDKGILDDFNHRLMQKFQDERMRGWLNLDNFTAGIKFEKSILRPLAKINDKIKSDIDASFPNADALINRINRFGVDNRVRAYFENIKIITNDENAFGIDVIFDKEQSLIKLTQVIAHTKHVFTEQEKNFLWYYLLDSFHKGFNPQRVGLTDQVLARLIASPLGDNDSELDDTFLQTRNDNIYDFLQELESKDCFFEETAARIILFNPEQIMLMVEKCLDFAKRNSSPHGVVFALALVNLKQIKSAVKVLQTLAESGAATEACGFMHRLLPLAKGGERVIVDFLEENLRQFKAQSPLAENEGYLEYITRNYLHAVKAFLEVQCYAEATRLLAFVAEQAWIYTTPELGDEFKSICNALIGKNKVSLENLKPAIQSLGLTIYEEGDVTFVGGAVDNPLTQARRRLEKTIQETTSFDVSSVLDKMSSVETGTYNALNNIRQAFKKKDSEKDVQAPEEMPIEPAVATIPAEEEKVEEVMTEESVTPIATPTEMTSTDSMPSEEASATSAPEISVMSASIPTPEPTATPEAPETPETFVSLDDVAEWEQNTDDLEKKTTTHKFSRLFKDKINLESVLKISSQDIDKHFEKIKQVADNAIQQAKEQVDRVKQRVDDTDIANSPSVSKIRDFAKKFKFGKNKKD